MKKLVLAAALLLSTACKGETEYGECQGFGKEEPGLKYELSTRNAVWTAIFTAGILFPVVWALEYAYCPVGRTSVEVTK